MTLNCSLRTLPTTAKELTGSKQLKFSWGLPLDFDRHRILEVSHSMLPGTSVQCVATGQKTTTEVLKKISFNFHKVINKRIISCI